MSGLSPLSAEGVRQLFPCLAPLVNLGNRYLLYSNDWHSASAEHAPPNASPRGERVHCGVACRDNTSLDQKRMRAQ